MGLRTGRGLTISMWPRAPKENMAKRRKDEILAIVAGWKQAFLAEPAVYTSVLRKANVDFQ